MSTGCKSPTERVVILIDMDCFYCQVEEKLNPDLQGKPVAVVQYNAFMGGGIIAVNYPARDKGVTRHMRGFEAKKNCPSIELVKVPENRGKADLTKYRNAGKEVANVLQTFTPLLERASVDEAYLDITEVVNKRIEIGQYDLNIKKLQNTFTVGWKTEDFLKELESNPHCNENTLKLAVGGIITEEIRAEVYKVTGYRCSAGIAHNKILAKLVCGLHKPNKQTILPQQSVDEFFKTIPVHKIIGLGGKFGKSLSDDLDIKFVNEITKFTENELRRKYDDKTATWLYNIARGINFDPVTTKLISKSIGSCKNFPGPAALKSGEDVKHWLSELSEELYERLECDFVENNRKAKSMTVNFAQESDNRDISASRTIPVPGPNYDSHKIAQAAYDVIKKNCIRTDGTFCVKFLGISTTNFEDVKKVREITSFFKVKPLTNDENVVKSPEEITSDDGSSSYSALTQELDEDSDDMIFYDGQSRKSPILTSKSPCHHEKSSFFKKYFENQKKNEEETVPEQRNQDIKARSEEQCPECHKKIPQDEFTQHQDHHFALKLSKEGRTPPKTLNVAVELNKKGKKRKKTTSSNSSILMKFVNTQSGDKIDDGATETCRDCGKKIKIEEFSSHLDYHTAKLLHKKLNPSNIPPATQYQSSKQIKTNRNNARKAKQPVKSTKGLKSFFKPL